MVGVGMAVTSLELTGGGSLAGGMALSGSIALLLFRTTDERKAPPFCIEGVAMVTLDGWVEQVVIICQVNAN